ncbi:MAG TPA: signal peptidase II [Arenicellales bacterium]|nr:signal peptidase II [Arenicellales bacterium]
MSLVAVIAILDVLSKSWAHQLLVGKGSIEVFTGFNLALVHNHGAAFGFLSSAGGWQRSVFIVLAIAIIGYLGSRLWSAQPEETALNIGFAGIAGGAVGNLTDRVSQGYVVDFLDFYAGAWHWPAFNLADIAISLGAGIVVADTFGIFKKNKKDAIND